MGKCRPLSIAVLAVEKSMIKLHIWGASNEEVTYQGFLSVTSQQSWLRLSRRIRSRSFSRPLGGACPDALAKFPPPHAFEFRTHKRNGKDNIAVNVGFRTFEYEAHPWLPRARLRNEDKRQKAYIDLYYTNPEGVGVNGTVSNIRKIKGNEVFGNLSRSGFIGPWSNRVKALLRFILVYSDHAANFTEFKDAEDKTQGLQPLLAALKTIASRTPLNEQSVEWSVDDLKSVELIINEDDLEPSDDEDDISIPELHGNKRLRDEDDETLLPAKKVREA
ncbi:hypothetical protein GQ44DRAFT_766195 [Phaeosphaeriaceae sp. PMI808]|nr:hypothetical protein GQ44DRAFT_766195 [Phaeosphaeriaceae sp. PMI808]